MVKSMTGFGRGCYEEENFSVTIEIKTVNHRYNETAIRLPHFLNPLEDKIHPGFCVQGTDRRVCNRQIHESGRGERYC